MTNNKAVWIAIDSLYEYEVVENVERKINVLPINKLVIGKRFADAQLMIPCQ